MLLAWTDETSSETLALYPPNDRAGMDIVTVEGIEGPYLGHPGTGAETVFTGRMSIAQPHISVGSITGPVEVVTFRRCPGQYRLWVAVADRQQSIIAWERWSDDDSDEPLPAIEHWWVTLQLVE